MIRFACPSCTAVFTVADEKGGKKGKCPKCQSDFLIPEAESPESPPPLPPKAPPSKAPQPAADSNDIEIKPCPGCQSKLVVEKSDLGLQVECPYCKTQYKAISAAATGSSSSLSRSSESKRPSSRNDDDDEDDRPKRSSSRRRNDDDEDDDRPKRKTDRFGEKIDDDDDDEDDRRQSRRTKKRRRKGADDPTGIVTAVAVLNFVVGALSLLCGGCVSIVGVGIAGMGAQKNAQIGDNAGVIGAFVLILGGLYLIFAIICIICGVGIVKRKSYGRILGFISAGIALCLAIYQLVSMIMLFNAGQTAQAVGSLASMLLFGSFGVFSMIVLFYRGEEFE